MRVYTSKTQGSENLTARRYNGFGPSRCCNAAGECINVIQPSLQFSMESMFQPRLKSVKLMMTSIYRPPKLFQLYVSQLFFFCWCLIYAFPTSDQMTP